MTKSKIVLATIIGILIIGLSILTYAFFTAEIEGQAVYDNVVQTTGTLSIEYIEGQNINVDKIRPGWSGTKTFKIKNNGSLPASYEIVFDDVINTFINDEVIFSGTCISNQSTCEDIASGVISKEQQLLKGSIAIEPKEEHSYELNFEFIETGENQDYNNQAELSGKILIYDTDTYNITNFKKEHLGKVYNFSYTGDIAEFTVPIDGTYKLEVWGAQGGNGVTRSKVVRAGGLGGYSSGEINLKAKETLYIVVGGRGGQTTVTADAQSGYNGGGSSKHSTDTTETSYYGAKTAGGGGATHIAKRTGLLRELSSDRSSILIVAGGGGGAGSNHLTDTAFGGAGGGINGLRFDGYASTVKNGGGGGSGSQTAGGTSGGGFGKGGDGQQTSNTKYMCGGGGGGGYFGGGGGTQGASISSHGGGGGSGYIAGLTNATSTAGVKTFNGSAKITIIKVD